MEKIVVTGMGIVSPLGLTVSDTWINLLAGQSGVNLIARFNTMNYRTKIGAELPENSLFCDYDRSKKIDRLAQYTLSAAGQAVENAGLDIHSIGNRTGVILGTGLGGIFFAESQLTRLVNKGARSVSPITVPQVNPNAVSTLIARQWQCYGPNMSICTACASSAHAIGVALDQLRLNRADRMIVGGVETPLMPLTFAGFDALRVMSVQNEHPQQSCRPFDEHRDGFVMGEGAAVLILEKEFLAKKRGALIYAEISGYGASNGAWHPVSPMESGQDAAQAVLIALNDAQLEPSDIQYINAHGTATIANDKAEINAIKSVFGMNPSELHISSTKAQTGHLIGAAGALETVFTTLAVFHQVEPATLNHSRGDPDCDLDYISNYPRDRSIKAALTHSFGFGNNNAVLAIKKWDG